MFKKLYEERQKKKIEEDLQLTIAFFLGVLVALYIQQVLLP